MIDEPKTGPAPCRGKSVYAATIAEACVGIGRAILVPDCVLVAIDEAPGLLGAREP